MFTGLVGTVIGGVALYYLPGIVSKVARTVSTIAGGIAEHLEKDFPDGTAKFGHKEDKKDV